YGSWKRHFMFLKPPNRQPHKGLSTDRHRQISKGINIRPLLLRDRAGHQPGMQQPHLGRNTAACPVPNSLYRTWPLDTHSFSHFFRATMCVDDCRVGVQIRFHRMFHQPKLNTAFI
ncbi:hypothetical protein D0843_02680, partial [Bordetella avium]